MRVNGAWVLIDWETLLLAPIERDLWNLDPTATEIEEYADATGITPDPALLDLYRLRWDLADLAVYVRGFRSRHPGDANDDQGWAEFQRLVHRLVDGTVGST